MTPGPMVSSIYPNTTAEPLRIPVPSLGIPFGASVMTEFTDSAVTFMMGVWRWLWVIRLRVVVVNVGKL